MTTDLPRESGPDAAIRPAEHLLVLPLLLRVLDDGRVLYDLQSRDNLVRYLDYFDTMIIAAPRLAESRVEAMKSFVWVPVEDLQDRVQFVPLPEFGSKMKFLRDYRRTARLLRRCIDASEYLQFAIGGGNGGLEHDWAAVAAEQAIRAGRKYALLCDAASFDALSLRAEATPALAKRLALRSKAWAVRSWQLRLIARCDAMFCNGRDTYNALKPFCRSPEIAIKFNDYQIGPEKIMDPEVAEQKSRDVLSRSDLRVCYAGRVEPQKAPTQWVRAIAEARRLGAPIRATWLGDGSVMSDMRQEVERLGQADAIDLPGFVTDRDQVINTIRESDVLAFTHVEPESPRVLIEALMSACPIVGYERSHPRDLISEHDGGVLTPLGDPQALGAALAALAADRPRLSDLIRRAARDGARFNSDIMTRDRSAIIRERVGRRETATAGR